MPKYSTVLRDGRPPEVDHRLPGTRRFPGNPWGEIAGWMDGFPGPSLAAYESGYLGFAPQRELAGLGVECVVAAVSKIPRWRTRPPRTGVSPEVARHQGAGARGGPRADRQAANRGSTGPTTS